MMKLRKIIALICAGVMALGVSNTALAQKADTFKDITNSDYYYSAVDWGVENGITEGVDEEHFVPMGEVNRAQAVTFLWRMEGSPAANSSVTFSDVVKDSWYDNAVAWAVENGIVAGTGDNKFSPEAVCSRGMCMTMLYRMLGADYETIAQMDKIDPEDENLTLEDLGNLIIQEFIGAFREGKGFSDVHEGDYYELPVLWGAISGVITEDNTDVEALLFNPDKPCVRAQMMSFLYQTKLYQDYIKENGDANFDFDLFGEQLSLWNDDAQSKQALTSYIEAITDYDSADYIPEEDRIAVFDLDGTLFCETDPNYFDYCLLKYRVLDDPEYKNKASAFEKEVALKIKDQNENGTSYKGLEVDHGKAVASAFKGMTVDEFNEYIQEFKEQSMPSYEGMTRGEGFYKPMLEVVEYLKANDFTVYVVSGTDRFIVRGIVDNSPLDLPNSQIIGSDETLVATGQGNADGLDYVYTDKDKLVLGGNFIIKNLKMNKVSVIMQEIGQQPVLSFGNSTGDASMAEYVTTDNKYKSLAFMLCCDDTERENGNTEKADKMYKLCEQYDWVPVSMKNDWKTIYGDGVTKYGTEKSVAVDYKTSKLYTKEDMDKAIDLIKSEFATWEGCTLNSISYAGDDANNEENLKWLNGLREGKNYTRCIEFVSNFHSPKNGGGAWEADTDYNDYQWWLADTGNGDWELISWGY